MARRRHHPRPCRCTRTSSEERLHSGHQRHDRHIHIDQPGPVADRGPGRDRRKQQVAADSRRHAADHQRQTGVHWPDRHEEPDRIGQQDRRRPDRRGRTGRLLYDHDRDPELRGVQGPGLPVHRVRYVRRERAAVLQARHPDRQGRWPGADCRQGLHGHRFRRHVEDLHHRPEQVHHSQWFLRHFGAQARVHVHGRRSGRQDRDRRIQGHRDRQHRQHRRGQQAGDQVPERSDQQREQTGGPGHPGQGLQLRLHPAQEGQDHQHHARRRQVRHQAEQGGRQVPRLHHR